MSLDTITTEDITSSEKAVEIQIPEPKPNKPHLFQPGQSGNPGGKPKGTKNFTSIVKEALEKTALDKKSGEQFEIREALANKIVQMALAGNEKMIRLLWNYLDGMPIQKVDNTHEGGVTIHISQDIAHKLQQSNPTPTQQ